MNLSTAIVAEIKADTVLSAKIAKQVSGHRIYPLVAPEGALPSDTIVYTEIDKTLTVPRVRTSRVQFSCFSTNYGDAKAMADDINRIFNDRYSYQLGGTFGIVYSYFVTQTELKETDTDIFYCVVEILFKY